MIEEKKVASIFTATAQLVEGRQITINGNFYEGESAYEANRRLDSIMDVLERQRKRFEIPVMKKELEQRLMALQLNMDAAEKTSQEIQRKGGKGNVLQLKAIVDVHKSNIEKIKKDIEKGQETLRQLEEEVSQGAAA